MVSNAGIPAPGGGMPQSAAPKSRPFVRVGIGCLVLLLLVCGIGGGYAFWQFSQQRSTYEAGNRAYKQGDCQTAIGLFDQAITQGGGLTEDSDVADQARREKAECEQYQAAVDQQESEPAAALLAYSDFIERYPDSPLAAHVYPQVEALFDQADAEALAQEEVCQNIDTLIERDLMPAADTHLPPLYLACGQTYEAAEKYSDAVLIYDRFRSEYPDHELAVEVEEALARASVAEAQAMGAGALPAPESSGGTGEGPAVVVIRNDSPQKLSIIFSGPETRIEEIEACADCQNYSGSGPEACPEMGPEGSYTLPPGSYNVVVKSISDAGVTPFSGQWDLQSGQEYRSCFFLVTR